MSTSSSWLARGAVSPGHAEITWTSDPVGDKARDRLTRLLSTRIPEFVLGNNAKSRMLVLEDSSAFYLVKLLSSDAPNQSRFLLVALQGHVYSQQEMQKLSLELNKLLDPNLDDGVILASIKDALVHTEPYDFLRPIKLDGAGDSLLGEGDMKLRVDEILPIVNRVKLATTVQDRVTLAKYTILLASKARGQDDDAGTDLASLPAMIASSLQADPSTSRMLAGAIPFNLGLVAKHVGQLDVSTRFFQGARDAFDRGGFSRLAAHAAFNQFLNARDMKDATGAPAIIDEVIKRVEHAGTGDHGFTGIVYRHVGDTFQERGDVKKARDAYTKALTCLDKLYYSPDTASIHSALGVIAFKEGNFFEAAKAFTIAINILAVLKREVAGLAKNLGISYLNLASEYLRATRILVVEKDADKANDLIYRGASYIGLAAYYLGSYSIETTAGVCRSFLAELQGLERRNQQIEQYLNALSEVLDAGAVETMVKERAKQFFESMRSHQPLKTYYLLILYKNNGLAVFTRESSTLHELPAMDGDLIGGMITGISSFLGEVLAGEEVLSLIDRNDVKIVFEHTPHFMGIVFCNKDTPRLRHDVHAMLATVETQVGTTIDEWNGDMTIFKDFETLSGAIIQ